MGRTLGQSVDAYNSAVGSLERQVLPGARKFTELGLRPGREIEELPAIEKLAREPRNGDDAPAAWVATVTDDATAVATPAVAADVSSGAPPGSLEYFAVLFASAARAQLTCTPSMRSRPRSAAARH